LTFVTMLLYPFLFGVSLTLLLLAGLGEAGSKKKKQYTDCDPNADNFNSCMSTVSGRGSVIPLIIYNNGANRGSSDTTKSKSSSGTMGKVVKGGLGAVASSRSSTSSGSSGSSGS
jgi:hypothetical protein